VRYRKKLLEIKTYVRAHRHDKDLLIRVKRIVQGYLNYFAINDNQRRVCQFTQEVRKLLFKYLNRRSQKRGLTWNRYNQILERIKFPNRPPTKNLFFASSFRAH